MVRRMHWLLFRTRLFVISLIGIGTITLILFPQFSDAWALAVLSCGAIGAMVFSEKSKERLTLATLGIAPGLYWRSRLLIPFGWTLAMWIAAQLSASSSPHHAGIPAMAFSAFAIGQLVSCLSSQLLLTICLSLIFSILMLLWGSWETLPVWLRVVPFAVLPLMVTRIICHDWLRDLSDRRSKCLKIGSIATALVLFSVVLGTYRVTQFPKISDQERASIPKLVSADQDQMNAFREFAKTETHDGDTHERLLDALLEDRIGMSTDVMTADDWHRLYSMSQSVQHHALDAISKGESRRAAKEIRGLLKLQAMESKMPVAISMTNCQTITSWTQMSDTSLEDLQAMEKALAELAPTEARLEEFAASGATFIQRMYRPFSDPLLFKLYAMPRAGEAGIRLVHMFAFWESWRAHRIGDLLAYQESTAVRQAGRLLASRRTVETARFRPAEGGCLADACLVPSANGFCGRRWHKGLSAFASRTGSDWISDRARQAA